MPKALKVRFDFFVPYSKDDEDREYILDISDFLLEINTFAQDDRTSSYFGTPVRMDSIHVLPENDDIICFHMVRLRDEGLASTTIDSDDLTDIDLGYEDYIAEDISGFFDKKTFAIMLQRNSHSLSISGLKEYLVKMHKKSDPDDDFLIYFKPVQDKEVITKAKNITNFRALQLKFATSNQNEMSGTMGHLIGHFADFFQNSGGSELGMELKSKRNEPDLKRQQMLDIIEEIENDDFLISSAIFSGKIGDAPVEKFDLLNGRLMTYASFNNVHDVEGHPKKYHLNPQAVQEEMYRIYVVLGKYQDKVISNLGWN